MIIFQSEGVELPNLDIAKVSRWLNEVASDYNRLIGDLVYLFCNDEIILSTNRQFLDHDYYTDIITFDNTIGKKVSADIYISLETVASNAKDLNVNYDDELRRVIVHGLLHLCGIKDKSPEERAEMESAENAALAKYNEI